MSTRLRKALSSAVGSTFIMVIALAFLDVLDDPTWWLFLPVAAFIGFLSQYYLWGRNDE